VFFTFQGGKKRVRRAGESKEEGEANMVRDRRGGTSLQLR